MVCMSRIVERWKYWLYCEMAYDWHQAPEYGLLSVNFPFRRSLTSSRNKGAHHLPPALPKQRKSISVSLNSTISTTFKVNGDIQTNKASWPCGNIRQPHLPHRLNFCNLSRFRSDGTSFFISIWCVHRFIVLCFDSNKYFLEQILFGLQNSTNIYLTIASTSWRYYCRHPPAFDIEGLLRQPFPPDFLSINNEQKLWTHLSGGLEHFLLLVLLVFRKQILVIQTGKRLKCDTV